MLVNAGRAPARLFTSLSSSCTHSARFAHTPSRPHASRASRYPFSPVTPCSGLRRTSHRVKAAPLAEPAAQRGGKGGGRRIFAHQHRRACVPSLSLPHLSVAHAHTQRTLCIRVDDSSIIHIISAASPLLCARFPSRTLLFSLIPRSRTDTQRTHALSLPLSLSALELNALSFSPSRPLTEPHLPFTPVLLPFSSSQSYLSRAFPLFVL